MAKIAFVDLLFNWPPDGGARADIKEMMCRAAGKHDVTLLVPDFRDYFPRGRINGDFPFRIIKIPFTKATFNLWRLPGIFKREIQKLKPDKVFIGDGWYLKFPLAAALQEYHPILRFYAYEGLCIKDYGTQFRYGRICPKNYLSDTVECTACALKHHRFKPLNMFSHAFLASLAFTPNYRRQVLASIRAASAVIVYNDYTREALGKYNKNIVMAPSGVDVNRYKEAAAPGASEKCTVLMTGRSGDPAKGFHVLIKTARILKKRGLAFKVVVPTYGKRACEDDTIEYRPWHSQEELPNLYAKSDICVVPSVWREPFGITAVEAMAAGKPVVASNTGGLQSIVSDGETGFLAEPGDAEGLADKLGELILNPDLRRKMGSAGRNKCRAAYDWATLTETHYGGLFK
jgi:glycosyltransferase involved in cell wall biosynthesis